MLAFNGLGLASEFVYASVSKIAYFTSANWKYCKVLQLIVYSANNQLREKIHEKVFTQANRKLFDENSNYKCFFIEECKIPFAKKRYRFCWQRRIEKPRNNGHPLRSWFTKVWYWIELACFVFPVHLIVFSSVYTFWNNAICKQSPSFYKSWTEENENVGCY